jgi:hypothetical protein
MTKIIKQDCARCVSDITTAPAISLGENNHRRIVHAVETIRTY